MWAPSDGQRAQIEQAALELPITTQSSDGGIPPATNLLFLINPEGTRSR